jgi:hypothetical protein
MTFEQYSFADSSDVRSGYSSLPDWSDTLGVEGVMKRADRRAWLIDARSNHVDHHFAIARTE